MTAPNHIVGGIVVTGVFCSLWNVNIFSNPLYITATIFGSLLPDIDHTKSIIGKAFYPLAKWLSRKYGHRTITHSIFFLLVLYIIAYFFEHLYLSNHAFSLILFFSVFSHLCLDMATLQGVPLLYPLYRNPCVIPGNPNYRIKSGDMRSEGIAFFLFTAFVFTFQGLFAKGFWTTYNQSFNDIPHVYREYKDKANLVQLDYDFTVNNERHNGIGYVVFANENDLFTLTKDTLLHISAKKPAQRLRLLQPAQTQKPFVLHRQEFYRTSLDSLNKFIRNKYVSHILGYTNTPVNLKYLHRITRKTNFNEKHLYNAVFLPFREDEKKDDTSLIAHEQAKERLKSQIHEKEVQIQQEQQKIKDENADYYRLKAQLDRNRSIARSSRDAYEINQTKEEIIQIEREIRQYSPYTSYLLPKLQVQLSELKNRLNKPYFQRSANTISPLFTGSVEFMSYPK